MGPRFSGLVFKTIRVAQTNHDNLYPVVLWSEQRSLSGSVGSSDRQAAERGPVCIDVLQHRLPRTLASKRHEKLLHHAKRAQS